MRSGRKPKHSTGRIALDSPSRTRPTDSPRPPGWPVGEARACRHACCLGAAQLSVMLWAAGFLPGCTSLPGTPPKLLPGSAAADSPTDRAVQQASYEPSGSAPDPAAPLQLKDFAPERIGKTAKRLIGKGPNPEIARQLLAEADDLYQRASAARQQDPQGTHAELFEEAAEKYTQAADRWPDSALEQDALFRAGESYFFADLYPQAEESYGLLLKRYENSKYLDVTMARKFQIAQYWHDSHKAEPHRLLMYNMTDKSRPGLDTGGHALRIWDKMRLEDPTGRLADDATMAAANAHFAAGKWIKADEFYTDLRKTFPSSEHQFNAHFLGLQAKLRSYQGPQYAGGVLDEAEKLIQQIRKQFPADAEREKSFLDQAYAEVRYKKAQREWVMGQYYDQRAEYRAARLYYETLVQDFGDTPFAARARQRQQEVGELPDTPPQRLGWLVSLFPAKEDVKPLIPTDSLNASPRK